MSALLYLAIGAIALAASICIVAAMAADDVDHYTEPEGSRCDEP